MAGGGSGDGSGGGPGGVQVVGRVAELWRYPVKSMGGSRVASVQLDGRGIHGDRLWAVRDLEEERTTSARRVPSLLGCTARYAHEPPAGAGPGTHGPGARHPPRRRGARR